MVCYFRVFSCSRVARVQLTRYHRVGLSFTRCWVKFLSQYTAHQIKLLSRYSHKLLTINNYINCPLNFAFARSSYLFHPPIFEKILTVYSDTSMCYCNYPFLTVHTHTHTHTHTNTVIPQTDSDADNRLWQSTNGCNQISVNMPAPLIANDSTLFPGLQCRRLACFLRPYILLP